MLFCFFLFQSYLENCIRVKWKPSKCIIESMQRLFRRKILKIQSYKLTKAKVGRTSFSFHFHLTCPSYLTTFLIYTAESIAPYCPILPQIWSGMWNDSSLLTNFIDCINCSCQHGLKRLAWLLVRVRHDLGGILRLVQHEASLCKRLWMLVQEQQVAGVPLCGNTCSRKD